MAANEIVNGIWRYPIKSMMGEEVQVAEVTARGLAGDRAYAFVDQASNRTAAVRTWASGFMSYRASFAEEPRAGQQTPAVRITSPDGETLMTSQPDIDERLSERFDRPLSLTSHARIILSDSGGLQEESTALGIPCLTLRENTERPVTITDGTNRLVGTQTANIIAGFDEAMAAEHAPQRRPPLWDGHTAERVAAVLQQFLA